MIDQTIANLANLVLKYDNLETELINQKKTTFEINSNLQTTIADLKAFVGYTDDDIYGVEVDFKNKKFTRLAGAVNRSAGSGFDGINCFGGRKRCNLDNSGNVIAYYGDAGFTTTGKLTQAVVVGEGDASVTYNAGTIVQTMVEQPKFYYKVVPLVTEKREKGSIMRKEIGRAHV